MPLKAKLRWTLIVLAGLLNAPMLAVGAAPTAVVTGHYGKSVRGTIDDLPFVVLRGTTVERAEAFGALCGEQTVQLVEMFVPVVQAKSPKGWDTLIAAANKSFVFSDEEQREMAAFVEGFRKAAPAAARRVKALGRELSADDLKAFHCFADLASSGRAPIGGCSSFSAWGAMTPDGQVIAGRNGDYTTFPGVFPFMAIAREPAEPDRLATIDISAPGVMGANTVINSEGVFLAMHDSWGAPAKTAAPWRPRVMPLRPAIEHARAATAPEDVAAALRNRVMAMGMNVPVSMPIDPAKPGLRPVVVEYKADGVGDGVFIRQSNPGIAPDALFCTNHFMGKGGLNTSSQGSTFDRFRSLVAEVRNLRSANATIDLAGAKKTMDAPAMNGDHTTYISVIALPGRRTLHVAVSPKAGVSATKNHWVEVNWEAVFSAK